MKKFTHNKKYSRKLKIFLIKTENKNVFSSFCIQEKGTKQKREKKKKERNWIAGLANRLKYDWNYFVFS